MPSTSSASDSVTSGDVPTRPESKTLDKGLRVLRAVAARPSGIGVADVSRELGLHRTIVYRLLGTLESHDLVTQDRNGRYRPGLGLVELSGAARADFRRIAHEPLRLLADATQSTAVLQRRNGDDVVSVLVVEPGTAATHVAYQLGLRQEASATPFGQAILAAQHSQEPGDPVLSASGSPGPWCAALAVPRPSGFPDTSVGVVALAEIADPRLAPTLRRAATEIGERMAMLGPAEA